MFDGDRGYVLFRPFRREGEGGREPGRKAGSTGERRENQEAVSTKLAAVLPSRIRAPCCYCQF